MFHPAALCCGKIIPCRPGGGTVFDPHLVFPRGEGFEAYGVIDEIFIIEAIKVVAACVDGQVRGPVIFVFAKSDRPGGIYGRDLIRAGAKRDIHPAFTEGHGVVEMLGQNGQFRDAAQEPAARPGGQVDTHPQIGFGLCAGHIGQQVAVIGMAFGLERIEREHDIPGRDRFTILKPCLGAYVEGHIGQIVGVFDGFSDQPVERVGFVICPHHEAVIDMDAYFRRAVALDDECVEAVECRRAEQLALAHRAALRGVRVGIVELCEIGRVFEITEGCIAVADLDVGIGGRGESCHRRDSIYPGSHTWPPIGFPSDRQARSALVSRERSVLACRDHSAIDRCHGPRSSCSRRCCLSHCPSRVASAGGAARPVASTADR